METFFCLLLCLCFVDRDYMYKNTCEPTILAKMLLIFSAAIAKPAWTFAANFESITRDIAILYVLF